MIAEYFFLALKNLRKRGLRSWLTMLGIFIGIAAVVSLISLSQGLETAIVGQFASLDPDKLLIQNAGTGFGPPGSTAIKSLTEKDLKLIENVNGVEFAIPRLLRVVEAELDKENEFLFATSIPNNQEQIEIVIDSLNLEIDRGKFLEEGDRNEVVVGVHLKEDHFDDKLTEGKKIRLQGEEVKIKGILKESSSFLVNSIILIPEEDLKELLDIEDEIDLIVVQVENQRNIEQVAQDIERTLRKDRNEKIGEETFSVETPVQSISAVSTILNIVNLIVVGIAAISILIGAVGIANTMFTSVLERRKEIGVMKSIGAKNSDVLKIFMIESSLLGLIGGVIGVILGLALAFLVSSAAGSFLGGINLQVAFSIPLITASITFSLLLGLLFGVIPALQASRLNPVEALRK